MSGRPMTGGPDRWQTGRDRRMNHSRGRAGAGGPLVLEGASLPDNAFMMLRESAKPGRAAKFCLFGGTGTVINTTVLYRLARRLGLPLLGASAIAVGISV